MESQPNFTVNKIGEPWLEGVGHCHSIDLPPLLFIRWDTVNELQMQFPDCTIWLTFETIHIRRNDLQFAAHWSDTDLLRSYCQ
ncbi:hypothetical protein C3Y94_025895 [Rhizobium ruizarguesonis]|uniref:hypothetical protein n=1 Tax=Rhizobium ruizarguesonis TaxID=2081791 RepID=UPI00163A09E2|nr:hypothetical protein [Rhizobium ruizarguesonis]MBC2806587.1 hypothetical protein [Rhizobium ruizarguesonis]